MSKREWLKSILGKRLPDEIEVIAEEFERFENLRIEQDSRIAELEQRLYVARDLLQQIYDCPVNWVESTIPKGGMNPDNPKHRGQVVGTQHISYTRLYNIASFLRQNIEHMLNTELSEGE